MLECYTISTYISFSTVYLVIGNFSILFPDYMCLPPENAINLFE